jgi:hypothetical protein
VRRFSSVLVFIAAAERDPAAAAVVAGLDAEVRWVVAAQAQPAASRRDWLRQHTGQEWSESRLAHLEQLAFIRIRRELQRRGAWQP